MCSDWQPKVSNCPPYFPQFQTWPANELPGCMLSGSWGMPVLWLSILFKWVLSRFSRVWPFTTLWTVARQAPLSMGFLRQEHWSGLPFAPPGHLPDMSPVLAGSFFRTLTTWETLSLQVYVCQSLSRVRLFATPRTVAHQAFCLWNSPGKNTGVGCHSLLWGIFSG